MLNIDSLSTKIYTCKGWRTLAGVFLKNKLRHMDIPVCRSKIYSLYETVTS